MHKTTFRDTPNAIDADFLAKEYLTLVDDSCVALLPHVVRIAVEFGLPELLAAGPTQAGDLAAIVGADPDSLYRLLRAMASVSLVTESAPRRFELSEAGRRLLPDSPETAVESVTNLDPHLTWLNAGEVFRTGRPAPAARRPDGTERDFFGHKNEDAAADRSFLRRMRDHAARCYGDLVSEVDWSRSGTVLDIGGGDGFVLEQILRHAPHLTGMLFDRPPVIAAVRDDDRHRDDDQHLDPVADRYRLFGGDFFEKLPVGADTHLLCSVLHNWSDERAGTLLARSRESLDPGGRLLIVEMLVPPGDEWHPSKWSDLGMMVQTGGRERTQDEYTDLLARGGYTVTSIRAIGGSYFSLIEAEADADADANAEPEAEPTPL
ncbi:MAG: methyltransferase [Catenulispora sp.]|nr:methyltransferase [Catenulispora sp.]